MGMGLQRRRGKLHPNPPSQSRNDSPPSVVYRLTCLKQASRDSCIRLLRINIRLINSDYLSRDDLAPGPVNAQMETLRRNHSSTHGELLGCWAWWLVCCVNTDKPHLPGTHPMPALVFLWNWFTDVIKDCNQSTISEEAYSR